MQTAPQRLSFVLEKEKEYIETLSNKDATQDV